MELELVFENCESITIDAEVAKIESSNIGLMLYFEGSEVLGAESPTDYATIDDVVKRMQEGDLVRVNECPTFGKMKVLSHRGNTVLCVYGDVPYLTWKHIADGLDDAMTKESEKEDFTFQLTAPSLSAEIHTLNELLTTHFTLTDKPKGGWDVLGGNPYDKQMEELKKCLGSMI